MNITLVEYRKLLKRSAKSMSLVNRRMSTAEVLTLCDRQNPVCYRTTLVMIIQTFI